MNTNDYDICQTGKTDRALLFLSLLSTFVTSFMGSALNLSVPALGKEFGVSAVQISRVVTAYMLACTALPVPFGRAAELIGRNRILAAGLGVFTAGSAGGSLAPTMEWLLCFRLLQGAGTAMIYSTSMSVLVSAAPESQRSRMLGYSTAATYLGLSAGPVLGGYLNQVLGWRWIFAAAAAISAVAFFCALHRMMTAEPEKIPASAKPSFDSGLSGKIHPSGLSILLYAVSVSMAVLGLSAVSSGRWGWILSAAGIGMVFCFLRREYTTPNHLLPVKWMKEHPLFFSGCIASMINYGANFVLNYQLSLYLQVCMKFSSQKAGFLLVLSPAVQAVLSVFIGKTAGKKIPVHCLAAAGMGGTAAVCGAFGLLQESTPLWMICTGLAGAGFACALFAAPNTAQVFAAAGRQRYSMASSVLSTMRSVGHSLCMALSAAVTSFYMGNGKLEDADPQQMLLIMKFTFFLLTGFCILGFFMALKKKI